MVSIVVLCITLLSLILLRHGPLSDCPISATESVVSEYVNLEEGSPKRVLIEQRYGKATILRLVAKYEEDRSNAEWFTSSTMPCPGCRVNVEKSAGCNHVSPLLMCEWLVATTNESNLYR